MASLTITPAQPLAGRAVVIDGDEFAASTPVTLAVTAPGGAGLEFDITTDEDGSFSTTDEANPATATLTLAGNAVEDETVTIGAVVYTWKDAPTTAHEVAVGADAEESILNLKAAINLTGTEDEEYGADTVLHPTVKATTATATTLKLVAKTGGVAGNDLASTETMTQGSFAAATFADTGSAATGRGHVRFVPSGPGQYSVSATDGTNTATAELEVWQSV